MSLPGDEDWRCRACNAGVPYPSQSVDEMLAEIVARR